MKNIRTDNMNRRRKVQKDKNSRILRTVILVIFAVVLVYGIYTLLNWYVYNERSKELQKQLIELAQVEKKIDDLNKENQIFEQSMKNKYTLNIDFKKLKEINEDTVAWLKIDNTSIDYPVVKFTDNLYYLEHNMNKKYDICGWIFMDYRNSRDFSDNNTTIYGHNMKSKVMFGTLKNIYNGSLGDNIDIKIYTEKYTYVYKVFSTYVEEPNLDIISNELTKKYLNNLISKSKIKFDNGDITIDEIEKMITLVTCNDVDERLVVHGYLQEKVDITPFKNI